MTGPTAASYTFCQSCLSANPCDQPSAATQKEESALVLTVHHRQIKYRRHVRRKTHTALALFLVIGVATWRDPATASNSAEQYHQASETRWPPRLVLQVLPARFCGEPTSHPGSASLQSLVHQQPGPSWRFLQGCRPAFSVLRRTASPLIVATMTIRSCVNENHIHCSIVGLDETPPSRRSKAKSQKKNRKTKKHKTRIRHLLDPHGRDRRRVDLHRTPVLFRPTRAALLSRAASSSTLSSVA